jgi:hypothetical protein
MGMTQQTRNRLDVECHRDEIETANLDAAWRRFRNELDARIVERFGVACQGAHDQQPDPDLLADLAFQRALMP